jgi:triosephosphate isomerase
MLANDPLEIVIAPISPFWIPTLNLLLGEEVRKRTKKDRKRNPNAIEVAAQNVFDRPNGAFTGELSAEQLMDIGLRWTLVGHSERRVVLSEDDSVCRPSLSRK